MPSSTPAARRTGSRAASKPSKKAPAKKPSKPTARTVTAASLAAAANVAACQDVLALFQHTFAQLFSSAHLHQILQEVKGRLYERDYAAAFGSQRNLEAYAIRWSPARALCYREVFLGALLKGVWSAGGEVVCVGGGAGAEMVAAAAAAKQVAREEWKAAQRAMKEAEQAGEAGKGRGKAREQEGTEDSDEDASEDEENESEDGEAEDGEEPQEQLSKKMVSFSLASASPSRPPLHLTAIDIADWAPIVESLDTHINDSFLTTPDIFSASFHRGDILSIPPPELSALVPRHTRLITFMFVTNELYTQSRAGTTKLLLSLAGLVDSGCLLLVLESAGSYSTVKVGERVYPMGLLLDRTLLGGEEEDGDWEKLRGEETVWYRLPEGLRYPVPLENMRYFIRVFRRK